MNSRGILYDRVVITQQLKSRLLEVADKMRGDLVIPPCTTGLEGGQLMTHDVSRDLSSILSAGVIFIEIF